MPKCIDCENLMTRRTIFHIETGGKDDDELPEWRAFEREDPNFQARKRALKRLCHEFPESIFFCFALDKPLHHLRNVRKERKCKHYKELQRIHYEPERGKFVRGRNSIVLFPSKMSKKALGILREIMSLKEQTKETIEHRIKNEWHPCLSSLIKELIKKSNRPQRFHIYETENDDYFIRANEPKLLKWHSSNGGVYDDAVDVDVETFLEEEIRTLDNVLRLLKRLIDLGSKKIDVAPWWRITRKH